MNDTRGEGIDNKGNDGGEELRRSNPDSSGSSETTGPAGGRMTEGGEKPGPATSDDSATSDSSSTDAPVSGISREDRSEGIQSRGESVE